VTVWWPRPADPARRIEAMKRPTAAGALLCLLSAAVSRGAADPGRTPRPATFVEIDGVVSMEAEHATRNDGYVVHTDGGEDGRFKGFSGEGWLESNAKAKRLDFQIVFTRAGRYWIHLRTWASHHKNNGFHALFDGRRVSGHGFYVKKWKRWGWYSHEHSSDNPETISFTVDAPGVHVFSITRREEEAYLDKIVLHDGRFGKGPLPEFEDGAGPPETRSSLGRAKSLYDRAAAFEKERRLGAALEVYDEVAAEIGDWDFGGEAARRAADLKERRDLRIAEAEKAVGEKRYSDASRILDALVGEYGRQATDRARELRHRIRGAPGVASSSQDEREAAARKALFAAREALRADAGRGYEALRSVERSFRGTEAAKEARLEAEGLMADPGSRRAIEGAESAREAARLVRSARNYILNGRYAEARGKLRRVVDEFAGTDAAGEAAELMRGIRAR
jgi:tetratricopeptide (TPR) repeat protein